jgi:hypothetical protein
VRVVKRSSRERLACYTKVSALDAFTTTATFTIGGNGKVRTAEAVGLDEQADRCIAATISKLTFGKPKDGQPVDVSFPLAIAPGSNLGAFASLTGSGKLTEDSLSDDLANSSGGWGWEPSSSRETGTVGSAGWEWAVGPRSLAHRSRSSRSS